MTLLAWPGETDVPPRKTLALGGTTGTWAATRGHFGGEAKVTGFVVDVAH